MDVQIEADRKTVWVNDALGCCIGRFSAAGIDVHATGAKQLSETGPVCLDCIHGLPFDESWERFKASMLEHHSVSVSDQFKPTIRTPFGR